MLKSKLVTVIMCASMITTVACTTTTPIVNSSASNSSTPVSTDPSEEELNKAIAASPSKDPKVSTFLSNIKKGLSAGNCVGCDFSKLTTAEKNFTKANLSLSQLMKANLQGVALPVIDQMLDSINGSPPISSGGTFQNNTASIQGLRLNEADLSNTKIASFFLGEGEPSSTSSASLTKQKKIATFLTLLKDNKVDLTGAYLGISKSVASQNTNQSTSAKTYCKNMNCTQTERK